MRTFSDHCAHLGCPLTNIRWSWCAIAPDGKRAVFTLWSDEIKDRKFVLYPTSERRPHEIPESANQRLGAVEAERIATQVAENQDIAAYGILCFAKDTDVESRERETFDDRTLFRLRVERSGELLIAHLVERIPTEKVVPL
jgi:5-methylcytosine-specific restriction protein A